MKRFFSHPHFRVTRLLPRRVWAAFAVALLVACGWTHAAMAQAATLGDVFCNLQSNMVNFGDLFSAVAYIAGAFFIGSGLYDLVKHHDNPREKPLHHPILKISGGAALMAAPDVATALVNTFFTTSSAGGINSCNPTTPTSTAGGVGLDVLITNLVGNIMDPLTYALSAVAIVIGLFMIVRGLLKASKYGVDPRSHSMTNILSNLSVGALLIVVGQSMGMVLDTIFGTSTVTASSVVTNWNFIQQLNAGTQFTNAIIAALHFFQLVGLIAFIRGWMIMKSASEGSGQATMAQGITHIIGGTLALNIFSFLQIMDSTFGTGFLT